LNSNLKLKISNYLNQLQNLPDKQKKIILWAVVGVLALIMGIFWLNSTMHRMGNLNFNFNFPEFGQNSQQEQLGTSEKVYQDTENGFEIVIPQDWNVEKRESIVYISSKETSDNADVLTIEVKDFSDSSLSNFVNSYYLGINGSITKETVKIAGQDAMKVVAVCQGVGCGNPSWFATNNDKIYIFASNLSENTKTFEQIISTFKFINQ